MYCSKEGFERLFEDLFNDENSLDFTDFIKSINLHYEDNIQKLLLPVCKWFECDFEGCGIIDDLRDLDFGYAADYSDENRE